MAENTARDGSNVLALPSQRGIYNFERSRMREDNDTNVYTSVLKENPSACALPVARDCRRYPSGRRPTGRTKAILVTIAIKFTNEIECPFRHGGGRRDGAGWKTEKKEKGKKRKRARRGRRSIGRIGLNNTPPRLTRLFSRARCRSCQRRSNWDGLKRKCRYEEKNSATTHAIDPTDIPGLELRGES